MRPRARGGGVCVLRSSRAGTLGGLGFAAYAGASAYLDRVAQEEDGHGARWVSIAWDGWRFDTGAAPAKGVGRKPATAAIRPAAGAAIFARVVSSGLSGHVLVSIADLDRRADEWTAPQSV